MSNPWVALVLLTAGAVAGWLARGFPDRRLPHLVLRVVPGHWVLRPETESPEAPAGSNLSDVCECGHPRTVHGDSGHPCFGPSVLGACMCPFFVKPKETKG